jgi:hypothetical protein
MNSPAIASRVALAFAFLSAAAFGFDGPLTISTQTLFTATVGLGYAQTFQASGGTLPYRWSIVSGDTAGLTLEADTGTLHGTPKTAGTYKFRLQVQDSKGVVAAKDFSLSVVTPTLTIVTAAALADGAVSSPYSQTFAATGGTTPYTWSMPSGSIPGLALDASSGVLSGTPTTAGTYAFTIQTGDSGGLTATRSFDLKINAGPLKFSTSTQLPGVTLNTPVSVPIQVSGGIPPYTWTGNGLPDGLTLDSGTGILSGIVAAAGDFAFTIRVGDSAHTSIIDLFHMTVSLPPPPTATVSGLPAVASPASQIPLKVSIDAPYAAPISGQALLTFAPDAGAGDSTIQFASGGRTANFTIPMGSTDAAFDTPLALQTGTVAGSITVALRLTSGGTDITSSPAPAATTRIERAAPVITSARLVSSTNGFSIEIFGYATSREITQGVFKFHAASGQSLQNSEITIPLDAMFQKWFADAASAQYGSQFFFSQTFTVQGDAKAITADSVTLTNRTGSVTASITQ